MVVIHPVANLPIFVNSYRSCLFSVCHYLVGRENTVYSVYIFLLILFVSIFSSAFAYYPSGEILHYYCCKNLTSPPSSEHNTPRHSPTPEDNLQQRYWLEVTHYNSHARNKIRWILPNVISCTIYLRCSCRVHFAACVSRVSLPSYLVSQIENY